MGVSTTHRINLSMWILIYSFSDTYYVWAACVDSRSKVDVTKTGNGERGAGSGERGTGNGSLGTSCQRKPPQKSKMAVQKKAIRALVEIRWGRNCKSDSHLRLRFEQVVCFFDIQPVSFTI